MQQYPITFFSLLNDTATKLHPISPTAQSESLLLCSDAFNISKEKILSELSTPLNNLMPPKKLNAALKKHQHHITRRICHEPLAYILRYCWFKEHQYQIKPGILIPRSDTEILIDTATNAIQKYNPNTPLTILEIGFGNGIISIELALQFPKATIIAWDINKKAHKIAIENSKSLNCPQITWINKDFFKDTATWAPHFQSPTPLMIISNPPYIKSNDIPKLEPSVKNFEPKNALNGGTSGLKFYKKILKRLQSQPRQPNLILFEIGIHQKTPLKTIAHKYNYQNFVFINDTQQIPRVMILTPHKKPTPV